jgi:hypothetical protein
MPGWPSGGLGRPDRILAARRAAANLIVRSFDAQWLKGQKIDPKKVLKAIKILSAWRVKKYDPFVCAMVVSAIWL